jgi:Rod binding domain-containing protein
MDKMPIPTHIRSGGTVSSGARSETDGSAKEKLKKASTEFEALFIQEILKFMRQTIPAAGLTEPGPGKEIYQSLLDQELSKNLAKKGGLRIGEMVYRQMSRKEEKRTASAGPMNPLPQRKSGPEAQ